MPGKRSVTEHSKNSKKRLNKKVKAASVELNTDEITTVMKERKPKNSKLDTSATLDLDADGATEYLDFKEIEGETVLDVECGPNKALMYLSKLCQGSKGSCVSFEGSWLTPNEFQYVSGRETAKDWKRSIRHQGKSIKLLFSKGIIVINSTARPKDKSQKKKGQKRRHKRLVTLVSLESSRDEITESQDSPKYSDSHSSGSPRTENPKTNGEAEHSEDEGLDVQSDSTENYDLDQDGVDTTEEDQTKFVTCEKVDTESTESCSNNNELKLSPEENMNETDDVENHSDRNDSNDDENKDDTIVKETEVEVEENTAITQAQDDEQSSDCESELDNVQSPEKTEIVDQKHDEISDSSSGVIETQLPPSNDDSKTEKLDFPTSAPQSPSVSELPVTTELEKSESVPDESATETPMQSDEKKDDIKKTGPTKESKLGNIIDQLRVNQEKITREPVGDAVSLASGPDQVLPTSDTVADNCSKCEESQDTKSHINNAIHVSTEISETNNSNHTDSTSSDTKAPKNTERDASSHERHMKLKDTGCHLSRTGESIKHTIKQEVKDCSEKSVRHDILYNHIKQKELMLKSKHKHASSDRPPRPVSGEKVRKMAPTPDKLCGVTTEKDYNDYMKLLAAKQEHNPFSFIPPPLHDPYYSLWNPDLTFSSGLFNPYLYLGQNGLSSSLGKQSSPSLSSAFCPFPPSSLPFLTPPRSPYAMSYPFLDSSATSQASPKESPTLPHSGQPPSRKRGSAETDNACALDLSTKRPKLDSNKNAILSHSISRYTEGDKCMKKDGQLESKHKHQHHKLSEERSHHKMSHSDPLRHSKYYKAWTEKEGREIPTQCACGADNQDNIMNWSVDKVYDFVCKLEGCSSYAKTFRDNRIEGKTLPLLTTDTLIRNLGLKVGPAIILSEAVTRHVQDMSRFFHPCSYCKMKSRIST